MTQRADFDRPLITRRLQGLDQMFDQLFPATQRRVVRQLVDKGVVGSDQLVIQLRPQGIVKLMAELLNRETCSERPAADQETSSS